MSFAEDGLLPLSGLQHLVFCERQWALIHLEQQWRDSAATVEGSSMHARVDEDAPRREVRGNLVVLRGLVLRSLKLGLVGRADVVELQRPVSSGPSEAHAGGLSSAAADLAGEWVPFPIEYKRGKPKADHSDDVQLCAQALCLEEMLCVHVPEGALFYGRQRRRHVVRFDDALRMLTTASAARMHELFNSGNTPTASMMKKCERCSMLPICLPEAMGGRRSAADYLAAQIRRASRGEGAA